jgi:hypothetical protein
MSVVVLESLCRALGLLHIVASGTPTMITASAAATRWVAVLKVSGTKHDSCRT